MASFASSATTGGARKAPRPKKAGENNGQLRFHPPPRVVHASRLDQKKKKVGETMASFASSATTCGASKHAWTKSR